ncbi:hypothetical protein MRB53_000495 [Persea americana]|uniref:Uncharacterized protein n=1 Tax=Persea americana TaxID=3435 RepID=A0ACC2MP04_PERAE|nr:hypothetical protein MRB53_000495 [Persea americana]
MKSLLDSVVSNGGITDYSTAGKELVSFELINLMESDRQRSVSVSDMGKGRGAKGMRMLTVWERILPTEE